MKNKRFSDELAPRQILDIDACTQCGECLKHCPVQEVTGNPAISPPEKIRMFRELIRGSEGLRATLFGSREPDPKVLQELASAAFECVNCGACGQHCPVGISGRHLWQALRKVMVTRGVAPPDVLKISHQIEQWVKDLGNMYGKPTADRFKPWFPENVKVVERAEIAYFAGCTGSYKSQPMVRGDVLALAAVGEPFCMLSEEEEVCCGFPLLLNGLHDTLHDTITGLVERLQAKGAKVVISSCPCCVNVMSLNWPGIYGKPLPFKIKHITQFTMDAIRQGKLKFKKELNERVIYHDSCSLSRGVNIIEEPRDVLRSIPGLKLLEFENHGLNSRCCGVAGLYRIRFQEKSYAMARLTIDEAVAKKADRMISSCPACFNNFQEAVAGHTNQLPITDLMELVSGLI
jgi:heterodisulfide reductase subunit D